MITSGSGLSIVMLSGCVAVSPALSLTWTVNALVWTVVGVPEKTVECVLRCAPQVFVKPVESLGKCNG